MVSENVLTASKWMEKDLMMRLLSLDHAASNLAWNATAQDTITKSHLHNTAATADTAADNQVTEYTHLAPFICVLQHK